MIRSVIRSALIATLAVGVSGFVQCVRAETNVPNAKVGTKVREHSGEVVSVDLKANTITIKHDQKNLIFKLTSGTKITGDGKKGLAPADLKAGEHVIVHYTGEANNMVATHIGHVPPESKEVKDSGKAATVAGASRAVSAESPKLDSAKNPETSKLAPGTKININTASAEELDKLPGIGTTKAQAIVDYRTANGPFKSPEDIENVKGIKEGTFTKIKDYITVR